MSGRKVTERTRVWRRKVFDGAIAKSYLSSEGTRAEVLVAVGKAGGRLRAIEAKRAMYALMLYVRGKRWQDAKEAARLEFAPWFTPDQPPMAGKELS